VWLLNKSKRGRMGGFGGGGSGWDRWVIVGIWNSSNAIRVVMRYKIDRRDNKVFGKIIIEFIGVVVVVRYWIEFNRRYEDKC
jgi:hypothetical protein